MMRTLFKILFLASYLFIHTLWAQATVKYSISFPNAAHHEAEVTIEFMGIKDHPLRLLMSRASPGRYALHEFAKNVYNVQAFDKSGKALEIHRPNVYQWDVKGKDDYVRVTYTVFGDFCDGTYLAIDNSHAHMNIPATFMWARGFEEHPLEIRFNPANKNWKVATQLKPSDDPYLFTAPNLDYFMDSPTELSDFKWCTWSVTSADKTYTIRIAMHNNEADDVLEAIEKTVRVLVNTHMNVFGELPEIDYGTYTFICCFLPQARRDGMEHRNSTILTSWHKLSEDYFDLLDGFSHEFFHCWNVERLRPASLQPFDFTHANMSGELWFAEGFTNYFSELAMARAGLYSSTRYAKNLSRTLNFVLNSPGLSLKNAVQMSQYAPFVDAGRSNDPKNLDNTYISYYSLGETIGLGLDLTLREKFPGLSIDDFMKAAWQKFGKKEIPYSNADLQQLLAEVSGDATFAADFFDRYIYGHTLPDYGKLLPQGGFILEKSKADSAWAGGRMDFTDGKMIIDQRTLSNTPLYRAGLDMGDTIYTIGGDTITSQDSWTSWLSDHAPGQSFEINYNSRGIPGKTTLTLHGDPILKVVPFEKQSGNVTAEVKNFRQDWLGISGEENPNGLQRYCPRCGKAFPFSFDNCPDDSTALQLTKPKY